MLFYVSTMQIIGNVNPFQKIDQKITKKLDGLQLTWEDPNQPIEQKPTPHTPLKADKT